MILVIRIKGRTNVDKKIGETLKRLKIHRKFACVLIDEKDDVKMGMLKKVKDHVAYGAVDDSLVKELKEKRGQK